MFFFLVKRPYVLGEKHPVRSIFMGPKSSQTGRPHHGCSDWNDSQELQLLQGPSWAWRHGDVSDKLRWILSDKDCVFLYIKPTILWGDHFDVIGDVHNGQNDSMGN